MRRWIESRQSGLYRSRKGLILGVCRGVAEYFGFSVFWIRAAAVLLLFLTGLWPMTGIYFLAGLIMKPEPALPLLNEEEREFYHDYLHSPRAAASRLKRRYEDLERRIERMEDKVTSREFGWEERMQG
jgi:phage shock protein C